MRKYLLLVVLSILSQLQAVKAQTLFTAPDTVCIRQAVHLNSTVFDAASYYWGFCSGAITSAPTGTNMGDNFGFHTPSCVEIQQDRNGQYYGFVLNAGTDEFLRINYGTTLNNPTPTVTNFGNLTNGLPHHPTSLYVAFDTVDAKWYIFVTGGYDATESTVGRIDFGPSLGNPTPNIANFGPLADPTVFPSSNAFNGPKGIFVAKDANMNWYGYLVNRNSSELVKLNFGLNISNTPTVKKFGGLGGVLNQPTDMAAILDNGQYYFFVTNRGNSTVARINIGTTLDITASPIATNLGDFLFRISIPSSISMTRDCGALYAYITDSTTSQLISINMATAMGPYTAVDYSVVGGMNFPSGISGILRDKDDLYAFVTNVHDSTLTKLTINQCSNASIPSFTEVTPPVYSYDAPGTYNIYYVINQGLPNMQVECKTIYVLPFPNIFINVNPTICEGDSIKLYAISNFADSFTWSPIYHIDTAYHGTDTIKAYPDYTQNYNVHIHYPDGCTVDTFIHVNVVKVDADAGPDRTIADGATTVLGGPDMSLEGAFSYHWTPFQYIDDTTTPFPSAHPPFDFTYTLEVTEHSSGLTCQSRDTVVVHVNCGDFYLPNAFAPDGLSSPSNRFGILNQSVAQLNYFRIFDRWGVLVFQTASPNQAWDGTYNGTPCPTGVYVWEADGFCTSGKPIKKKGNVSLLR